jgi:hypothetical protein
MMQKIKQNHDLIIILDFFIFFKLKIYRIYVYRKLIIYNQPDILKANWDILALFLSFPAVFKNLLAELDDKIFLSEDKFLVWYWVLFFILNFLYFVSEIL